MCPAETEQGDALSSHFSSHTVNKHPFSGLFFATFLTFVFLCVCVTSLFKMAPSIVLQCYLTFLCARRLNVPYGENSCVR